MNQRIKLLAEQAGLKQRIWNSLGKGLLVWQEDPDNPGLEKFAELIVKECLEVVEKQFGGGNGDGVEWDRAVEFTYNDVKQHFGVEE